MYKNDHKWYTYEECIAYYGKARGEIEWRTNHWTQSEVDEWEGNNKKQSSDSGSDSGGNNKKQREESSDSEPDYDYAGYDPNDSS